ncbi:hypothetical protein BCR41DRAFT_402652 [Lobosporangium transversale]|uniref:Crinkler effector protein N-terminal domain-containing protein n=1 Tax=Lobosporangium transversale TaxID=64571 RepID=A0A1Y2G514_9FUNG|nr:hypothetical protein BCR41DRAFT_402652 [Lobosporangium transversale]ORY90326.1 hypothetical protein BCR41DRAFT_402652 [Lobosporangium transversale]|eukprot:XP_021875096.1 hypothetical protein BCR41DRAFT_402652 [Lobosporangium transversale]
MTQKIMLFCILDGDSSAFKVQLDADDSIAALKKAIKKEKENDFREIVADKLNLWHVSIVIGDDEDEKTITLSEHPNAKKLCATSKISEIFGTTPEKKTIHVIVQRPSADPSTSTSIPRLLKKKRWTVNEPIRFDEVNQVYYVDPADHDNNEEILQGVFDREIVMLIGARASGKTTRLYRLITQLADFGYRCLPLSFEGVAVGNNEPDFWKTFGNALRRNYKVDDITTKRDFLDAFGRTKFKDEKIVILVDEFDLLFNASDEIRNQCLQAFRAIRQNNHLYAIDSIVLCGTFSLQHLSTTGQHIPRSMSTILSGTRISLLIKRSSSLMTMRR